MEGTGTHQVADDLGRSQATIYKYLGKCAERLKATRPCNPQKDPVPKAAHDPEATHIVMGDGAGFHHKKDEEPLPRKIKIITLPAYSPELNPVEKLWDIV